jgi:hypothetical protein
MPEASVAVRKLVRVNEVTAGNATGEADGQTYASETSLVFGAAMKPET